MPATQPSPRSYCHACGSKYSDPVLISTNPHRWCDRCDTTAWANPVPVSVMLQPVYDFGPDKRAHALRYGLLVGKRGIHPKLGEWGLPGGFVDLYDPSYEAAAVRELGEEVEMPGVGDGRNWTYQPMSLPQLLFSLQGDPGQIISFSMASDAIPAHWLDNFKPCPECPSVRVAWAPEELCFASHTEAMRRWFATDWTSRSMRPALRHETRLSWKGAWELRQQEMLAVQEACAHQWEDAPDLYDHHKGESFQRCTVCLKTV